MKITARSVEDFQKAEEIIKSIEDPNFTNDIEVINDSSGLRILKVLHGDKIDLPKTLRIADVDIIFPSEGNKTKQIKVHARVITTSQWIYILFSIASTCQFINIRAKEVYHAHATTI